MTKKVKFKIKKGDSVKIIAGNNKGKIGIIKLILSDISGVIIEGINTVKRAIKKKDGNENFITLEKPIHISNVKLLEKKKIDSEKKVIKKKIKKD